MIYRLLIDTITSTFDAETGQWRDHPSQTNLRGVFTAGLSEGLGDIPYPRITNPRARFFFTEAGWKRYVPPRQNRGAPAKCETLTTGLWKEREHAKRRPQFTGKANPGHDRASGVGCTMWLAGNLARLLP